MADLLQAARVRQSCSGNGAGNLNLLAPISSFQGFADAFPVSSKVTYCVQDGDGVKWEIGRGTLVSSTELSRDYVYSSSASSGYQNTGNPAERVKINLSANSHQVFNTIPPECFLFLNDDNEVANKTPLRGTVFLPSLTAMVAESIPASNEIVICFGGSALGDGGGGVFRWDSADAAAPDNVNSYRNANSSTGLYKRVPINLPHLLALTGGTMTGALTLHADPTQPMHAATRQYVDNAILGLSPKASVKVATTANITLSAPQTIDGVAVIAGERVLVKNQTAPAANGIYVVGASAWSRASDMDAWSEVPGAFCFIEQGTTNGDTAWVSTANAGGTLGTTAIVWSQFGGVGLLLTNPAINAGGGSIILPLMSTPNQTAEGQVVWDTDDDKLTVGTGAGRKTMTDTDSPQQIASKSVLPAGGNTAITLESVASRSGDVRSNGATVASADNQAFIMSEAVSAYNDGRPLIIPAGEWKTSALDFTKAQFPNGIDIIGRVGSILKLKPSAPLQDGNTGQFVVRIRSSNSSIKGVTLDFAKDDQNRTYYNTNLPNGAFVGLWIVGETGLPIENVKADIRVLNSAYWGVLGQFLRNPDIEVQTAGCGAGLSLSSVAGGRIRRAYLDNIDNEQWKVYCHGVTANGVDGMEMMDISIIDQSSYDVAGANSMDDWFSGITLLDCKNIRGRNFKAHAKNDNTMTKSVGISMLGVSDSDFSAVQARRHTSVHLEIGGCRNVKVAGDVLDGEYMRPSSSLWPSERQDGIHTLNQGLYPRTSSRILTPNVNCDVEFNEVTGMQRAGVHTYIGEGTRFRVASRGNLYGCMQDSNSVNESFPTGETQITQNERFEGSDFSFNEGAGFLNRGGIETDIAGVTMNNNGQARNHPTPGTTRGGIVTIAANQAAGYLGADGTPVVTRARTAIKDSQTQDNQTVTGTIASASPDTPDRFHDTNGARRKKGQYLDLVGCGVAGATLRVCITKIINDEIYVTPSIVTFPTSTKSGTLSTNARAITGSGTAFLSEIQGRMVLKNGANYRVIAAAWSNTAGNLEVAFPANLSSQPVEVIQFTVNEVRSQNYGIRTESAANDVGLVVKDHDFGTGNVVENTDLAVPAIISLSRWATPIILRPNDFAPLFGTPVIGANSANNRLMWRFDPSVSERIVTQLRIPPGVTGKLRPVIYWTNAAGGSGNVVWRVCHNFTADGGATDTATVATNVPAAVAPAQNILEETRGPAFAITPDSILHFGIDRGGIGSDTLANDVGLFLVALEIV